MLSVFLFTVLNISLYDACWHPPYYPTFKGSAPITPVIPRIPVFGGFDPATGAPQTMYPQTDWDV